MGQPQPPWFQWWPGDQEALRAHHRRASIVKVDDSGPQQLVDLQGLASDAPTKVVRVLPHGFSSNPPADSEGIMKSLGGRSDRAMFIGGEHPDKRPRGLDSGGTALYDADGKLLKMVKGTTDWNFGGVTVTFHNGTQISIEGTSDVSIGVAGAGYVHVASDGTVHLGVASPFGRAPCKVLTECGPSQKVYAVLT